MPFCGFIHADKVEINLMCFRFSDSQRTHNALIGQKNSAKYVEKRAVSRRK